MHGDSTTLCIFDELIIETKKGNILYRGSVESLFYYSEFLYTGTEKVHYYNFKQNTVQT